MYFILIFNNQSSNQAIKQSSNQTIKLEVAVKMYHVHPLESGDCAGNGIFQDVIQ